MREMKKRKRAYKSPVVRTEKVYERKGLACGKVPPMGGACATNAKLS
jgi:hypothetical protein